MNILVLTPKGNSFNSIRPEAEIYVSLKKAGHNVVVMTNKESKYISRYKENGVEVIETEHKKKIETIEKRQIGNQIKSDEKYDEHFNAKEDKTLKQSQ